MAAWQHKHCASFEARLWRAPQDEGFCAKPQSPHPEVRSAAKPRRTHSFSAAALATLLIFAPTAHAVQPEEVLKDPVAESRARKLSTELRCLVCQNESIDDSSAPLAKDLRLLVRERITAGDSDAQVKSFLVQRYGEFVLLKPPFSARTALLWSAPFLAVGLGGLMLWRLSRRRIAPVAVAGLSEDEKRRLEKLLGGEK
jgi:cytochrome c-type biogenesis protein CcmH